MVGLVLFVVGFWLSIFAIFFVAGESSVRDRLWGELEPLPLTLGQWRELPERSLDGRIVEERYLLERGGKALLRQRRSRDPVSRLILEVEPEQRIVRARART